jgi:hypothetical protein
MGHTVLWHFAHLAERLIKDLPKIRNIPKKSAEHWTSCIRIPGQERILIWGG